MNTPTTATPSYRASQTPEVEVCVELHPDGDDDGARLIGRLFLHGEPVETVELRGAKRLIGLSLVNLFLADHRRRPSDDLGSPPPWN